MKCSRKLGMPKVHHLLGRHLILPWSTFPQGLDDLGFLSDRSILIVGIYVAKATNIFKRLWIFKGAFSVLICMPGNRWRPFLYHTFLYRIFVFCPFSCEKN